MERHLQKLSWMRVRELVPDTIDTIIFPVGTIEAHGSACLGTDNFIPEILADGIAGRINALIAPTVNYGITKSLYGYNGGCTVDPDIFRQYIREILESFVDSGFANIILMNGHGGNNAALKEAAFEFHTDTGANIAVIHWWELCAKMTEEFFGHVGGHAGTDENAMVQTIDDALLDRERYTPDLAWHFRQGADIYPIPGTILLYKQGEGLPEFDAAKASEYRDKVVEAVGAFAETVIERWRKFGLGYT